MSHAVGRLRLCLPAKARSFCIIWWCVKPLQWVSCLLTMTQTLTGTSPLCVSCLSHGGVTH